MPNPESLRSATKLKSYAPSGALGADANLVTDGGAPCRRIRVGVAGDLKVTMADGSVDIIYAVQIGEPQDVQAVLIWSSGTSAQKITVFW